MSQNRQEEKDRARALNDYKGNLKTELLIRDIYEKLEMLLEQKNTCSREAAENRGDGEE